MEKEIINLDTEPQGKAENSLESPTATTPETTPEKTPGLTLKFNKEIREIPYDEAVILAQKGLKFDKISSEFERLKNLAQKSGKSIGEYISSIEENELALRKAKLLEGCAGNEELAEHILNLENEREDKSDAFGQLKKEFPEINSVEDLPDEVKETVDLFGGNLLSAYLLYEHRQRKLGEESRLKQQENAAASVGPKQNHAPESISGVEEFIKGIWS